MSEKLKIKERPPEGQILLPAGDHPSDRDRCRARVRIYTGKLFPSYVRCRKRARPGLPTCWHHQGVGG